LGRTIPTATLLIQDETDRFLKNYGAGLGKIEKESLYNVLQLVKRHNQAVGQSVRQQLSIIADHIASFEQEEES